MKKSFFYMALFLFFFLSFFQLSYAASIESIPNTEIKNDFALGGGKTELELSPGEETTSQIMITNRLGREAQFKTAVEDFTGSQDSADTSFNFLGDEKSPYSLKDSIFPEETEFLLKQGERITLPIKISIPKDAEPGGRYGAVLIWAENPENQSSPEKDTAQGQVRIKSRLAALFYVRIKGDVKEDGSLKSFTAERNFYEKGPVKVSVVSENKGNVHLKPEGKIEITNIIGKKIEEVPVSQFFVLPNSIRQKDVIWDNKLMLGYYTAKLTLDRGYDNLSDSGVVHFWVIPWKILLAIFVALVVFFWLIYKMFSKFEIKRKK